MPAEILVIDDEKIVGNMCQRVLEAEGYSVEAFTDSVLALERIKEKRFDIVVTDLKMEKVNGMDILREVNERYPGHQGHHVDGLCHPGCGHRGHQGEDLRFFPEACEDRGPQDLY